MKLRVNKDTKQLDLGTIYAEQEVPAVVELRKAPVKLDDDKSSNIKGKDTISGCDIEQLDFIIKRDDEKREQMVKNLPELILPQSGPTTEQISRLRFIM